MEGWRSCCCRSWWWWEIIDPRSSLHLHLCCCHHHHHPPPTPLTKKSGSDRDHFFSSSSSSSSTSHIPSFSAVLLLQALLLFSSFLPSFLFVFLLPSQSLPNYHSSASDSQAIRRCGGTEDLPAPSPSSLPSLSAVLSVPSVNRRSFGCCFSNLAPPSPPSLPLIWL